MPPRPLPLPRSCSLDLRNAGLAVRRRQVFTPRATRRPPGIAREEMADTQPGRRALTPPVTPRAPQVPPGALFFRVAIPFGEHPQPEPGRQPPRLGGILAIFHSSLLLTRGRVRQGHGIADRPQPSAQPLPLVGRFDDEPWPVGLRWSHRVAARRSRGGHSLLLEPTRVVLKNPAHRVVCLESDASLESPLGVLLAGGEFWPRWGLLPSRYCPVEEPSR